MVTHTYNPSAQKAEAGGLQIQASLGYLTKTKEEGGRKEENKGGLHGL